MIDRTTLFTASTIEPGDRRIVVHGRWAIATDGVQWILQRRRGNRWENLSFVRTTRDILARCMREKGASPSEMAFLGGLPDRFQEASQTNKNTCDVRCGDRPAPPAAEAVMRRFNIIVREHCDEYVLCQVDSNPEAIVKAAALQTTLIGKIRTRKYFSVRFVDNRADPAQAELPWGERP